MFKLTSNYILGALAIFAYASVASAAPSQLEARDADASVSVKLCQDINFGHCLTIPVITGDCRNFVGGLSGFNKEVSSALIELGFACTFYRSFSCLSTGENDSVVLEGTESGWPDFRKVPGVGGDIDFSDKASSVSCSVL